MKHLAATLLLATVTVTGAYAMGSSPQTATPAQTQGQPAGFGDETTLLHRPTPSPQSSTAPASKEKKPLTASLSKDEKGKENTATFSTSDPKIYLTWKAETAVKGDKVRVAWYAEDTGGVITKGKKLTELMQILPGPGAFGTSYLPAPKGGFPAGTYRADVYDGKTLAKSLKFTVKK